MEHCNQQSVIIVNALVSCHQTTQLAKSDCGTCKHATKFILNKAKDMNILVVRTSNIFIEKK